MELPETMKRWCGRAFGAKGGALTGRTVLKRGAVALGLLLVALGLLVFCMRPKSVIPDADLVVIPNSGYRLQRTEVTQRQWEAVMGYNPSEFRGLDRPVENVSWEDCQEFIKRASAMDGRPYRLPTEEEWEYACRAGSEGDWGKRANGECGPLDVMGWCRENSGDETHPIETHPVAQKEPNAWGLYDMHGNVCEWCADGSGGLAGYAIRGGSWIDSAGDCSASHEDSRLPRRCAGFLGFRLAVPRD